MTRLHELHDRYGQSPWLDNLTRGDLTGGRLRHLTAQGIRGVTSNPTVIHKAISGSTDYDRQLAARTAQGDEQIIEAYLSGLEAHDGDLSRVHSVASFFVSRVDTEVDLRLEAIGTSEALALRGNAGGSGADRGMSLPERRPRNPGLTRRTGPPRYVADPLRWCRGTGRTRCGVRRWSA
jgi:transaldolase